MTGRERMNIAMRGGKADRVPFNPQITWPHAIRQLEKKEDYEKCLVKCYTDPNYMPQLMLEMGRIYGSDAFRCIIIYDSNIIFEKEGRYYNVYRKNATQPYGYLDTVTGNIIRFDKMLIKKREDIETLRINSVDDFLDSDEFEIVKYCEKLVNKEYSMIGTVKMPMNFLVSLRTVTQALYDLNDDESMVLEICEICLQTAINKAKAYLKTDVDTIMIGDSSASSSLISPAQFSKFVLPYIKRFCTEMKSSGLHLYVHICGNVKPIIDLIADSGTHCFEPMDVMSNMDAREFRTKVGRRISLMGGVDTTLLADKSPDVIRDKALECVKGAGEDGGYILAAADMVPFETPRENVLAMSRVADCSKY